MLDAISQHLEVKLIREVLLPLVAEDGDRRVIATHGDHRCDAHAEPLEAESICRDILALDPDNQEALVLLILSLSEQFAEGGRTYESEAKEKA